MTALLTSVRNAAEARIVLRGGADIVDLKDPERGALGAVSTAVMAQVVDVVAGRRLVSAVMEVAGSSSRKRRQQVERIRALGIDIVKIPMNSAIPHAPLLDEIAQWTSRGTRLVAVLMAEDEPTCGLVEDLASAGVFGLMLDTRDKAAGSIVARFGVDCLMNFVNRVRGLGVSVGLAGSLQATDIAPVLALKPDYLGFRGALCAANGRAGQMVESAVRQIRVLIPVLADDGYVQQLATAAR